jgi:hypothetical protein
MEAMQGWIEKEGFITLVMSQQSIKIQLPKPISLYMIYPISLYEITRKAKLKLREKGSQNI